MSARHFQQPKYFAALGRTLPEEYRAELSPCFAKTIVRSFDAIEQPLHFAEGVGVSLLARLRNAATQDRASFVD